MTPVNKSHSPACSLRLNGPIELTAMGKSDGCDPSCVNRNGDVTSERLELERRSDPDGNRDSGKGAPLKKGFFDSIDPERILRKDDVVYIAMDQVQLICRACLHQ